MSGSRGRIISPAMRCTFWGKGCYSSLAHGCPGGAGFSMNSPDVRSVRNLAPLARVPGTPRILSNNVKHINLQEEKTNKNRKISLNPKVKSKIEEYIEQENLKSEDYLFQSRKGDNKPISRVQAYRILNQVADRSGLDIKVGTHTLRKTFGYHHYRKYKDVAQLQAIFNHSSPDITLDYIGVTQEEIDRTVKEMYL